MITLVFVLPNTFFYKILHGIYKTFNFLAKDFRILAKLKTPNQKNKKLFSVLWLYVMIWPRYKATNIQVSHILNRNCCDTPKITAHFNQRPGQDTFVGAAAAPPAQGWRQAGRMTGKQGCVAQPGTDKSRSTPQRTLRSWVGLRGSSRLKLWCPAKGSGFRSC